MPMFARGGTRCLFIHIPKTGGTSVEHGLRRLGWKESLILHANVHEVVRHFKVSPQHYHSDLLDQVVRWEALDRVFTLCRHPFDRLKSEYYWQQRTGLAPAQAPEVWLSSVLERFYQEACAFDNHIRPQVDFITRKLPCTVIRVEDDGVRRALELADACAPAGRLRWWSVRAFPNWREQSTRSRVTEEAFAALRPQIEDFYAADMVRFGY